MKLRLTNQLNMVGATLSVANNEDYKPIWNGQPPLDFTTDVGALQTGYDGITAKAALVEKAAGGAGDVKAAAETALEDAAFVLTRALAIHFKKSGDLDSLAKVNLTKSAIQRLKAQDLVAKCTEIRDIANVAILDPAAVQRGVTAARISTLSGTIIVFTKVMNTPRGQIVNRSTLLKEIDTDTAGLLEELNDLDDLVIQFDGTDLGLRFIAAWKQARMIIDLGHGGSGGDEPTPPAPTTAPAK